MGTRNQVAFLAVFTALFLIPASAFAFGSAPPSPAPVAYTLPDPLRDVIVRPFSGVLAIQTPNQVTTTVSDLTDTLNNDLEDVVASASTHLSYEPPTTDTSTLDPCGSHLEIQPSVNAFEMNDASINLQFGFNTGVTDPISGEPSVSASDTVNIGNITLGLALLECSNSDQNDCQSLFATTANQTVLSNNFTVTFTLSAITASANILDNSDLNNDVTAIMTNGIAQLTSNPAMNQVPWEAQVAAVSGDQVTFLAGSQSDIAANQYFTVYAQTASSSQCGVYQALACLYTQEVDGPSSVGVVYQTLDGGESTAIEPGDVVEVGSSSCSTN